MQISSLKHPFTLKTSAFFSVLKFLVSCFIQESLRTSIVEGTHAIYVQDDINAKT